MNRAAGSLLVVSFLQTADTEHRQIIVCTTSPPPVSESVGAERVTSTHLRTGIPALGLQLVDLGLGDVSPLLRLVHLMLQFAELPQVAVGLFLLRRQRGEA